MFVICYLMERNNVGFYLTFVKNDFLIHLLYKYHTIAKRAYLCPNDLAIISNDVICVILRRVDSF